MDHDEQDRPDSYPLCWPVGWQRTKSEHRRSGRFQVKFVQARQELMNQLRLMGSAKDMILISSNIPTRRDGLPYAPYAHVTGRITDPGVAVYFWRNAYENGHYAKKQYVVACDSFNDPCQNLRSIGKTLEAMRNIKRWGASLMLERAFSGFEVLPPSPDEARLRKERDEAQAKKEEERISSGSTSPPPTDPRPKMPPHGKWWHVLGLTKRPKTFDETKSYYRRQVKVFHPDFGGSSEAMSLINQALEEAEHFFENRP